MPDSALRNNRSIWGGPGDLGYSVASGDEAVDLAFIRDLPADSVFDLSVGRVEPDSFAAVAHLRRACGALVCTSTTSAMTPRP